MMKDLFAATEGRALVLFTSYEMMKSVADLASVPLSEAGIRLLVQGEGLSRESMTQTLKGSGIPGLGNIQLKITSIIVLLVKMVQETTPVFFPGQLRIVLKTELYGSAKNLDRNDVPIGFSDYPPVNTSGLGGS